MVDINGMVSMVNMQYGNIMLYVINSVIGSFILIQLSLNTLLTNRFYKVKVLGKNSIIVLCTHMFIVEIIRLMDYKLFNNILPTLGYMEGFVFRAIVLTVIYMLIPLCNHYFKIIFGKKT